MAQFRTDSILEGVLCGRIEHVASANRGLSLPDGTSELLDRMLKEVRSEAQYRTSKLRMASQIIQTNTAQHYTFKQGVTHVRNCCYIFALPTLIEAALQRLSAVLTIAGPMAGAHWICKTGTALGHARLSIIDLTTGDQPIANEDGELALWSTVSFMVLKQSNAS